MNPYHQETNQFVEDLKQGQNNILTIQVAVRVRPLSQKEQSVSEGETVRILDGKVVVLLDPGQENNQDDVNQTINESQVLRKNRSKEIQFAFDFVFDQWVIQQTVYEKTTEFMINGLFDGYNATIFSYGATGSGKTFTYSVTSQKIHRMIGTPSEVGIMPRAMQSLFQTLQSDKLSNFKEVSVKVTYLEIYNENIRDLLTTEDKSLDVREDKSGGIVVAGITEVDVRSVNEVMALLKVSLDALIKQRLGIKIDLKRPRKPIQTQVDLMQSSKCRLIAKKRIRVFQSRFSKVVFPLSIWLGVKGHQTPTTKVQVPSQHQGIRMVEGAKINQSLLVLGNCIQALSDAAEKSLAKPFIPYRNSKLTRLLKDSLGGNCRTVMISNISPSVPAFEETYNTLVYANRAKNIKTVANRNVLNAQNHISNYAEMIKNLRQENEELKNLIQNNQQQPSKGPAQIAPHHQRGGTMDIDASINGNFAEIAELQRKVFDLEDREDNYQQNIQFITGQQRATKDAFEQSRFQDRIDNCMQQVTILQKSHKDLQRQYDEAMKKRENLGRLVESYEETAYRNYLLGLMKQGDLQLENVRIRHQDKRNRLQSQAQEQQIQMLKNQLKGKTPIQSTDNQRYALPALPTSSNQKNTNQKQSAVIPGVNSPFPRSNNVFKQQYALKRNLKLPPIYLMNMNKLGAQRRVPPQSGNANSQAALGNRLNYQQSVANRYLQQQQRSPSYAQPRSSKSLKDRNSANRSLDYGNTSLEPQSSYSVKRLKQMHDQYQAQRFQRVLSGKKTNQNSMPSLNNKILLPGMVHESPYVKNFQKDLEPIELKKERLKKLNLNLKDQGQAFQFRSN